jgi:hypothetical protein
MLGFLKSLAAFDKPLLLPNSDNVEAMAIKWKEQQPSWIALRKLL